MMNIAILHYAAPPIIGGVESVIGQHARLIVAAGYRVTIIAGRGEQTSEDIPFTSIPLVDSRNPQVLAVKEKLDGGIIPDDFERLAGDLAGILEDHLKRVDILVAHNVCSLNKNLILTAALKKLTLQPSTPRTILWHHDLAWTTPRYRKELYDGYPWDLLRTDWPEVIQVTVSEARRQELARLLHVSPQRIMVIPNGIDLDRFLKLEKITHVLIEKHHLLSASPLLLLPVRITMRKNIELAINTMAHLRKQYPQVILIVTGPLGAHNAANQAYHDSLIDLRDTLGLKDAVIFLADETKEYISDDVMADFYHLADALLLPSREEGFGIPVIEAGLAGLPIFCSDIPPLRHLGKDYVTYFSPKEESSVLAEMIYERLSGESTFLLKGIIKDQYSWNRIFTEQIKPLLLDAEG